MAWPEWSHVRVAKELGVARSMLNGWAREAKQRSKPDATRSRRPRLRRVEVVDAPRESTASTIVLELPGGTKVHCLTIEHLVRLLEVSA